MELVHSNLYSFSLEKLYSLVYLVNFSFLYCHYFKVSILNSGRIERKKSMSKHYGSYIEAYNLVLRLCKETLESFADELEQENTTEESSKLQLQIVGLLQMSEKSETTNMSVVPESGGIL